MLDTIGARDAALGDDLPYRADAWEQVQRGERPVGDELADAFFHLARVEERGAPRDAHGRFLASASCLDPLDPPLERLRARLGVEAPRWGGSRFAVALTHDVDVPWRWTRVGLRGGAARLKDALVTRRGRAALREAGALAAAPFHKVRRTDPWWSFDRILSGEAARNVRSTFFVMGGHAHRADGPSPLTYERLRPRLVETIRAGGGEVALHGSYAAAEMPERLRAERGVLTSLGAAAVGHRYHYLRADPHRNLSAVADAGFAYDSSLGFPDAAGFRAGIAHPFRPWDLAREAPLDLIEIPLAAMDVTFGEPRYLGLSPRQAEPRLNALLDWGAANGGGFALLWHNEWFDRSTHAGWGELYFRIVEGVQARGGACVNAGELASEARAWLR